MLENWLEKQSKMPKFSFHSAQRFFNSHSRTRLNTSGELTVKYGAPWSKSSSFPSSAISLRWDILPPGPLADSNKVTETPFLAKLHAQAAPEIPLPTTATFDRTELMAVLFLTATISIFPQNFRRRLVWSLGIGRRRACGLHSSTCSIISAFLTALPTAARCHRPSLPPPLPTYVTFGSPAAVKLKLFFFFNSLIDEASGNCGKRKLKEELDGRPWHLHLNGQKQCEQSSR